MKRLIISFFILLTSVFGFSQTVSPVTVPKPLGLPGDNLNLYAVLDLFKKSTSIEDFEHQLNNPDNKVNNLDLNNDGSVDYLRVSDYGKGDYHTIVIQDIISASENQDVAIIELQKKDGNMVHIQIVGDESLYGKNYIIEPQLNNATQQSTPVQTTPNTTVINNNYYNNNTAYREPYYPYYNVWGWPCVSFIFGPMYSPWVSPWRWAYYPSWWYGRPRIVFSIYSGYYADFGWNGYCKRDYVINQVNYNNYYSSRRMVSNTVQTNITKNVYRNEVYNNTNNGQIKTSSYPKNNYAPAKEYKYSNQQGMGAPNGNYTDKQGKFNNSPRTDDAYGNVGAKNNNEPKPNKWGGLGNNTNAAGQGNTEKPKWRDNNGGYGNEGAGKNNPNSQPNYPKQNKWNNGGAGGGNKGGGGGFGGNGGYGSNGGGYHGNNGGGGGFHEGGRVRMGTKGK